MSRTLQHFDGEVDNEGYAQDLRQTCTARKTGIRAFAEETATGLAGNASCDFQAFFGQRRTSEQ